ncbi:hypothetical protein L207DRAFT_585041 [Hyaloscypha variabilis F]|uniref:BZIP domain-containing protein n=1 Tax=Hyaloscypha variabilis (strain UAMH 11265 / GT02V1 / F) TaxID=1149755 RepID=A0A2J6RHZ9_HYAVF|nr:hypothetical protein L207DRAFT_585041 [Hyaloscypha variabilis F]
MALSPARAHKNFFDSCPIEEHAPMSSDPSALLEPGYSHNGLNYETYSQRTPNPSLENQALAHSAQTPFTYTQQVVHQSPTTTNNRPRPLPTSSSRISSNVSQTLDSNSSRIQKRKVNPLAARLYRQKQVDHLHDLERKLKKVRAERDALKVKAARLEGEVEALRGLVRD